MGAVELRNKIIQLLNTDNERYLKDVFEFAEKKKKTSYDDTVVTQTILGEPITQKEYIDNNNEAVNSFKKGTYKTQSEIRKKYQTE